MRGHVRKRGMVWEYTVDLGVNDGKRKQKSKSGFKLKKECEAAMAEIINKVEKGEHYEIENMLLKDYFIHWLKTYAKGNVSETTYKRYELFIKSINVHLGNMELNKIKPANIQKMYTKLSETLSGSTVLKTHRFLHQAFKHALKWQMVNNNPVLSVEPPKDKGVDMKVWDIKTVNQFLEDIKYESIFLPVFLAVTTGMRQGEICGLQWGNVNLDTGFISVLKSLKRINGKLELGFTKTDHSSRNISIIPTTINELKKHKQVSTVISLDDYKKDEQKNKFVCCWDDERPMDPHYVSERFYTLVRRKDKDGEFKYPIIRFHDLRHSFATLLLQQGVHPKVVSEMLGHSQISLTLDRYSHVLPNMQKEATEKLDILFAIKA